MVLGVGVVEGGLGVLDVDIFLMLLFYSDNFWGIRCMVNVDFCLCGNDGVGLVMVLKVVGYYILIVYLMLIFSVFFIWLIGVLLGGQ